ncbi:MAG: cohesin domain-containing protein [Candidatus Methanospirareceae archaeon]
MEIDMNKDGRRWQRSRWQRGLKHVTLAIIVGFLVIPATTLATSQTQALTVVTVNAPGCVKGTFDVTIDVDNVINLNSGQFDLSFDPKVINVTDVKNGRLDGIVVPVDRWAFIDEDTIRVIIDVPGIRGISGSGYLAKIEFKVVGKPGDESIVDISNGLLVDTNAEEIPAEWIDAKVAVPVKVKVNAPQKVTEGGTFEATIDVDNIKNFNFGTFDVSFDDHEVIDVEDVEDGRIDGKRIPVTKWDYVDEDTIRVMVELPEVETVSGSGYLAKIKFKVKGEEGDKSKLHISGELVKIVESEGGMKNPEEIVAEWEGAKITVIRIVKVKVNAPEEVKAGETFEVTIDVDEVKDLNSGQFDLSFDPNVINVTDVGNGRLDGARVPVDRWAFVDEDTIRVIIDVPGIRGISGSGYLAKIRFKAVGEGGDKSILDISNGLLVDTNAEEIPAEWIDAEVRIKVERPLVVIKVNKPVYKPGETQVITLTIENPTDKPVPVKLGIGFKIYEIMGYPYKYERTLFESGIFTLPPNFKHDWSFKIRKIGLPEGEYAWTAYLKDASGKKISESEAVFSVSLRRGVTSFSEEMLRGVITGLKQEI